MPDDFSTQLQNAIVNAILQASFAQNRTNSRDAAGRMVNYYGGGDMSGATPTNSFWVSPGTPAADVFTAQASRLPTADAEAMARAQLLRPEVTNQYKQRKAKAMAQKRDKK